MNITDIVSVSPVNPAHGRHEVHAKTAEGIDVGFQISRDALGMLTAYFGSFKASDTYTKFLKTQQEQAPTAPSKKKGS